MKTVTIHEAKTHLSRLVKACVEGEEIVIARGKVPMVKLVPLASVNKPRQLGLHRGLIRMAEDFDEPLDDLAEYR